MTSASQHDEKTQGLVTSASQHDDKTEAISNKTVKTHVPVSKKTTKLFKHTCLSREGLLLLLCYCYVIVMLLLCHYYVIIIISPMRELPLVNIEKLIRNARCKTFEKNSRKK